MVLRALLALLSAQGAGLGFITLLLKDIKKKWAEAKYISV